MPEVTEQPAKPVRSLTKFYVAVGVVIALGLFGFWFWRTWTVWWFDADEAQRRQAEAAARLGVPVEKSVDLGDGVYLDLVLIPAGRFQMGSPEGAPDKSGMIDDEKLHWASISHPFYIGKHEVTQEVWEKVMGTNPSTFKGARNPVGGVSWNDCQALLGRLNGLGKERGRFRLPTEAEWEWACRAGSRTRFCFGDADELLPDYAWFGANSCGTPHPVGSRKPNAWGVHDMHGNLMEWCGDWYQEDCSLGSPKRDPSGPASGSRRVLRGYTWEGIPGSCRSSRRDRTTPETKSDSSGVRVVLSLTGG